MADLLNTFSFEGRCSIRTVLVDGDLHWVAKDVAEALGYSKGSLSNINTFLGHVPEEWRGRNPITTPSGTQEMVTLTEQGLYFFLGRSDKPAAIPMQKWVAGEVLPSIRKTGAYAVPLAPRQDMFQVAGMDLAVPRTMGDALRGMAALADHAEQQHAKIQVLEPKAAFHDAVAVAGGAKSIREVAQVLGTGQNRFFKWLRSERMLLPSNLPYQAGLDAGHFKVIEQQWEGNSGLHVTPKTLVTPKGLIWIQKRWSDRNPALRSTVNLQEVVDLLGIPVDVARNLLTKGWAEDPIGLLPVVKAPEVRWDQNYIIQLWGQIPAEVKARYRKG